MVGCWGFLGGAYHETFGHRIEGDQGAVVLDEDVVRGGLGDLGPEDLTCVDAASLSSGDES